MKANEDKEMGMDADMAAKCTDAPVPSEQSHEAEYYRHFPILSPLFLLNFMEILFVNPMNLNSNKGEK